MNAPESVGSGHPRVIRLLERIEAYGFDAPDDPLGFETRLADDNGWTLGYARLVVAEYRRFLVLTQLAREPVSPSQDVDQAWHLHLTRTAHYAAFCAALFGRFLHHEPGRSDGGDAPRHRVMYDYTFKVYQRGFGVPPPVAIWPRPGQALPPPAAAAPRWTVPEPLRPGARLGVALVVAALLVSLVPGLTTVLSALMALSLGAFVSSSMVLAVAVTVLRNGSGAAGAVHWRHVLDPYEVAWFAGGTARMAMTAIVALAERGVLRVPGDVQDGALAVERGPAARTCHPVEAACLRAATTAGLRFPDACAAAVPVADAFERRLVAAGLLAARGTMLRRHGLLLLAHAAWLVACFARCRLALLDSEHPDLMVLFLALTIANAMALLYFARRPSRVVARAELPLEALRDGSPDAMPPQGAALALAVAQSGAVVLAGDPRFAGLDGPSGALGESARRAAQQKAQDDGRSGFGVDSGFGAMFGGVFRPSCGSARGASCGSGGSGGSQYLTPDLVGAGLGGNHGGGGHDGGGAGGGHGGHGDGHGGHGGGSGGSSDGGGSSCSGGGSSCSGGSSCGSSCSGGSSCSSGSSCGGGGSSD